MIHHPRSAVLAIAACVSVAGAQQQANIPIRQVVIDATSTQSFSVAYVAAWQWPDGSIVGTARERNGKVLVFDKDMKVIRTLADSSLTSGSMISGASFLAMPYRGDTTVVVDPGNSALIVLDRDGKQVRLIAVPRGNDMRNIATGYFGNFIDPAGRLVYRTAYGRPPGASSLQGKIDSSVIVRADFDRRAVDTLMPVRILAAQQQIASETVGETTTRTMLMTPNTWNDDWALLADGTVAVVRAQDYRVEWLNPDGTRASTPKLPFDWRRLTDEEKQAKLDTLRRQNTRVDSMTNRPRSDGRPPPLVTKREFVELKDVPDYYPPLLQGSGGARVFGDADNRLWIAPSTSSQARGGTLMDVVSKKGVIEERVQLPPNAGIAGFGANGTLILRIVQPDRTNVLARAHIVR